MYYDSMEKLGWHKRDLLVSRVQDARDEQQEAKEEFQTALEKFTDVVGFEGGDLQSNYDKLNDQFERCERQAGKVRDRIESIESVAIALFDEWETELETYSSPDLRRRSEEQLVQTRARYDQLIGAMHRAEQKMEPVLVAFGDQVLFLKHNLNAQAIASLQGEVVSLESDVGDLIAEMEAAIAEANSFIQAMGQA
jgi:Ribonuclease G/E